MIEKDDTGDSDSVVGCCYCALLLEADEMLCGTHSRREATARVNEEFNESTEVDHISHGQVGVTYHWYKRATIRRCAKRG